MKLFVHRLMKWMLIVSVLFSSLSVFAQDNQEADADINRTNEMVWYNSPWLWIIGTSVLVMLLIALLRQSDARNR